VEKEEKNCEFVKKKKKSNKLNKKKQQQQSSEASSRETSELCIFIHFHYKT
jgi:hypothetical protein